MHGRRVVPEPYNLNAYPGPDPSSCPMAEDETTFYVLVIVAVVAVLGLGLAVASVAWNESFGSMMGPGGGGMMGGTGSGTATTTRPGIVEWAILTLSGAFFLLAVVLLLRGRAIRGRADPLGQPVYAASSPSVTGSPLVSGPSQIPSDEGRGVVPDTSSLPASTAPPAAAHAITEPTLVKLLGEDERRMYLELRDHGGQMYQRDLVALGLFSKAKVTRLLDKLEAKGLVVREAHGMTNRVRLTNLPAR